MVVCVELLYASEALGRNVRRSIGKCLEFVKVEEEIEGSNYE